MATVKDPKASILPTYNWIRGDVSTRSPFDSNTADTYRLLHSERITSNHVLLRFTNFAAGYL